MLTILLTFLVAKVECFTPPLLDGIPIMIRGKQDIFTSHELEGVFNQTGFKTSPLLDEIYAIISVDPCNSVSLDQQNDNLPVFELPTKSLMECSNAKSKISHTDLIEIESEKILSSNAKLSGLLKQDRFSISQDQRRQYNYLEFPVRDKIISVEKFSTSVVISKVAQLAEYLTLINHSNKVSFKAKFCKFIVAYDDDFISDWQVDRLLDLTKVLNKKLKFSIKIESLSITFSRHSEGLKIFKNELQKEINNLEPNSLIYSVLIGHVSQLKNIFYELSRSDSNLIQNGELLMNSQKLLESDYQFNPKTEKAGRLNYTSSIRWLVADWDSEIDKKKNAAYRQLTSVNGLSIIFNESPGYTETFKQFLLNHLKLVLIKYKNILYGNMDSGALIHKKRANSYGFEKLAYESINTQLQEVVRNFKDRF